VIVKGYYLRLSRREVTDDFIYEIFVEENVELSDEFPGYRGKLMVMHKGMLVATECFDNLIRIRNQDYSKRAGDFVDKFNRLSGKKRLIPLLFREY
jgi:hypothetical protein